MKKRGLSKSFAEYAQENFEYFSLSDMEGKFKVPQHVLIYLCEKEVVVPDLQDTTGRGRWRQFSRRNLFEFALALELRKYEIPIAFVRNILVIFRATWHKALKGPSYRDSAPKIESLLSGDSPLSEIQCDLYLYGGEYLVITTSRKDDANTQHKNEWILGFNLERVLDGEVKNAALERLKKRPDTYTSFLTINLSALYAKYSK